MALTERQQQIRQKIARGEALDPAEELEWMDVAEVEEISTVQLKEVLRESPSREIDDDEEDTEHHDVGLRRNALNILIIERGDMYGTAIPFDRDIEVTLREINKAVQEIYAARRQQNRS